MGLQYAQILYKIYFRTWTMFQHSDVFCLQFYVLTHLHPTPAVCGLPTEEARRFIAENGR